MKENCARYFQNRSCEYFPCHGGTGEDFNCLFCYCPLYALGEACGGNFVYTEKGIKDCSNCTVPHSPEGFAYVTERAKEVAELAGRNKHGTE